MILGVKGLKDNDNCCPDTVERGAFRMEGPYSSFLIKCLIEYLQVTTMVTAVETLLIHDLLNFIVVIPTC